MSIQRNSSNLHDDATGLLTGYVNPITGKEVALDAAAMQALVSGDANPQVLVYGATPDGLTAAIRAARLGLRVWLLSESERLGGIMGWGINHQDVNVDASPGMISGLAREILERIGRQETADAKTWQRYHRVSCDTRPSWVNRTLSEVLAAEPNIRIFRSCTLAKVEKSGTTITAVEFLSRGLLLRAEALRFLDATDCQDLMAAAGCSFVIGREANATYGESLNGTRNPASSYGGITNLDPYITPGNSGSGLLPWVDSNLGTVGAADGRVMTFNYRFFVTTNAADRVPFPAPDATLYNFWLTGGYFEPLARAMQAASGTFDTMAEVFQTYPAGFNTSYFDLNGRSTHSTNYPDQAECREYIEATPVRRQEIGRKMLQWCWSILHWIRNSGDSRIPAGLVTEIATFGLAASELGAYDHASPEPYIREGRMLRGDQVFNETNLTLNNGARDQVIAWLYYPIDSHTVRFVNSGGALRPEGSFLTNLSPSAAPQLGTPIPYWVLTPKRAECTNLLCTGGPSMTRPVWCSARMEPIQMMFGDAGGAAMFLSIEQDCAVQDINVSRLQRITDPYDIWDGIVLDTSGTYTQGTVTQDPLGSWTAASTRWGFTGPNFLSDGNINKGKKLTFAFNIQETGVYEVLIKYPPDSTGRANNVPFTMNHADGATNLTVNQLYPGGKGGTWESLGAYTLRAGLPSVDTLVQDTTGTTDFVVASAVKLRRIR